MLTIQKEKLVVKMTLKLIGRLDTTTAPDLDAIFENDLDGVTDLLLDFSELEYVSSAGLRALLVAQKKMSKQGKMEIAECPEAVREVFDITGFSDILTVL